jgi:predicted metal-dependent HD superfamily phosphohydrolase
MSLLCAELRQRWGSLFNSLGINSSSRDLNENFSDLFNKYSESHRYYHTPKHLWDCLQEFDKAKKLLEEPLAVESALWFHDVVYDTHAKDNEEKSAQYASRVLCKLNLPEQFVKKTENLVLLTKHNVEPKGIDEKLILDIDLAILGKPQKVFDEYELNIRKEYSWVGDHDFMEGRSKILQYFLNRSFIYRTSLFRERYEASARRNLEISLRNLKKEMI